MSKIISEKEMIVIARKKPIIIGTVLLTALLVFAIWNLQPKRSVESYCKTYTSEGSRLSKYKGDTFPSALFQDNFSSAGELKKSYDALGMVAPDEIQSDLKTMSKSYEILDADPSKLLSVSLAAKPADANLNGWTSLNCK